MAATCQGANFGLKAMARILALLISTALAEQAILSFVPAGELENRGCAQELQGVTWSSEVFLSMRK